MPFTNFRPAADGLLFANSFYDDAGRCGGMAYASLDYFITPSRHTPKMRRTDADSTYVPSDDVPLGKYIYDRQCDSLPNVIWKISQISGYFNLLGNADTDRFRWGLVGEEFQKMKASIDAGKPCQLGLVSVSVGIQNVHHQVLAIGYTTGSRERDLRIHVYDPNMPRETDVFVPDITNNCFTTQKTSYQWRTYFVDESYGVKTPPNYENGWRRCSRCLAVFSGLQIPTNPGTTLQILGTCPGGGSGHVLENDRAILRDTPGTLGKRGWRRCSKCRGLHYNPNFENVGVCPGGGTHNGQGSPDFVLFKPAQAPRDIRNFFRCRKCKSLTTGGAAGICPAGGSHDPGTTEYVLPP